MKRLATILALVACCACATAPEPCPEPEAPSASPPTVKEVRVPMDAKILAAARASKTVREIRVYIAADGSTRKEALYHEDAHVVPEKVKATVKSMFPEAKARYYEYELYNDGKYVFEVEVEHADGSKGEVSVFEDGSVKYVETEKPVDTLSDAVKAIAMEKVPGGKVVEVEEKKGANYYRLSVKVKGEGNGHHYLVFDQADKLLRHSIRYPAQIEIPAP